MPIQPAYADTPAAKLARAVPSWAREKQPDPVSNIKGSKGRPIKRPRPTNVNMPPRNDQQGGGGKTEIESVGSGAKVYLEPLDGTKTHRIRSIKTPDDGASVLKQPGQDDLQLQLKGIKAKPSTPLQVEDSDNAITIGGNNVSGSAEFNIGGNISVRDGIVESINTGDRGGSGNLTANPCQGSGQVVLSWSNGLVTSGDSSFDVGNCSSQAGGS